MQKDISTDDGIWFTITKKDDPVGKRTSYESTSLRLSDIDNILSTLQPTSDDYADWSDTKKQCETLGATNDQLFQST